MLKKLKTNLIASAIAMLSLLSLMACGGGAAQTTDDLIAEAERFIADNDPGEARAICTGIVGEDARGGSLTIAQLCRIAGVYAAVADTDSDADHYGDVASAVICLQRASEIDSDSLAAYIRTMSLDTQSRIAALAYLIPAGAGSDSICVDDEHYYADSIEVLNTDSIMP